MKNAKFFRIFSIFCIFAISTPIISCCPFQKKKEGKDIPISPNGYSWISMKNANAWVLKPDNWSLNIVQDDKRKTFFVIRPLSGDVHTSFVVLVDYNIAKREGIKPSEISKLRLEENMKAGAVTNIKELFGLNVFVSSYTEKNIFGTILDVHSYMIPNDETDMHYLFKFRSESNFEKKDWGVAKVIFDNILIKQKK